METPRVRLGELLVRAGLISAEQLEEALAEQRRIGKRLGSLLVESGLVSETQVTQILSQQLSVPWVSLHHIDFSRELLNLVPVDVVEKFCLIPIYVRRVRGLGDALYVAMDDPTNTQALTEVAERAKLHVRAMIAPPSDIREALRAYYGVGEPPPPAAAVEAPSVAAILDDDTEEDVPTGIHPRIERRPVPEAAAAPLPEHAARPPEPAARPPEPASPAPEPPKVAERVVPPSPSAPLAAAAPPKPAAVAPAEAAPPSSGSGGEPAQSSSSSRGFNPESPAGQRARTVPQKPGARKMIALTLLDGTTIRLPAKNKKGEEESTPDAAPPPSAPEPRGKGDEKLTARDLVAALRAASHGADASEILGENVRWEAMFSALLSVLLKKHLITDWEFVEEFKKL